MNSPYKSNRNLHLLDSSRRQYLEGT